MAKRRRKKNLKTSTAILIGVGVLVGVPILLFGVVAVAAGRMISLAHSQLEMFPLSGSQGGYSWNISPSGPSYRWVIGRTSDGTQLDAGTTSSYDDGKFAVRSFLENHGVTV